CENLPVPITFDDLRTEVLSCTRCPLAGTRTNVVFGVGDPNADLMFVGEAPGAEEDKKGEPFVGRSGQLLDRLMAEEMGMQRKDVYIANVLKCRPPGNRDPHPTEIATCRPYLAQQVDTKDGIRKVRGRVYPFLGRSVIVPTYHPAAALRGGGEVLAEMRADFVRAKQELARR